MRLGILRGGGPSVLRICIVGEYPVTKLHVLLTVGLLLACVARDGFAGRMTPTTLLVRFDVGSDHPSVDQNGHPYSTDQEWTPQTQAGYIGGHRVWSGKEHPVDGTPDGFLHTNQRHNWEEYRFSNVPNGKYLVTLSFSEIGVPSVTIFDVAIEDQTVLDDFRIFDQVGGNYSLTRRFAVTVEDGELNVVATPGVGYPRMAAIVVEGRRPDTVAPAEPAELATTSSYHAVLLDWPDSSEDDLDGYHIYRATRPDGLHTRLTTEPTHTSRYQDASADPRVAYHYCISAVDVYGNESASTSCLTGVALDESDATLPLYALQVPPENLLDLYSHIFSDDEVDGRLTYQGQTFPVRLRYRGGYGRFIHKKSWKIRFPDNSPFLGRDQINLRADYSDRTLMHSKLAADLFEAAGVDTLEAEHVLLTLNGEYWGVYTLNEHMDEGFLKRTGQNPDATIYKAIHTGVNDFSSSQPSEEAYRQAYEKKTNRDRDYSDIIAFIELINATPDETFAYELGRVFDVASYLDYYAIIVLTGNRDFVQHNAYLVHDLRSDRWKLVPYDFDGAFEPDWDEWGIAYDSPIDRGTSASPVQPWGFSSVLLTRVLDVPQFRAYYCHRLSESMNTIFSDAAMQALIDEAYVAIEQDGLRDWHKLYRESNAWFVAGPDELQAYVTDRKRFLWGEIPAYCRDSDDRFYLNINEVMIDDPTPWLEIHNKGLEAADLSGMILTNDLADLTRFQVADGSTIPAGGFITFFADGDPGQGPLHTSFQLGATGGQIGIFSGTKQIDAQAFGSKGVGVSEGRYPDGVGSWRTFNIPTPGSSNLLPPPVVSSVSHVPAIPTDSDAVTVRTTITDDGAVLTTTLHFSATGSGFVDVGMTDSGENLYSAQIAPQPDGVLVEYYITAGDNDGQTSTAPHDYPDILHRYLVGYRPQNLVINEFMADNETTLRDPDELEEFPDWIELYNPGRTPIDLGGKYLTDDLANPTRFRIPDGLIIPANGFTVFYADNDPEQGSTHTNFRLSRNGESIGLFDVEATDYRRIDAYTFGRQGADVSARRFPNGGDHWGISRRPTPGE